MYNPDDERAIKVLCQALRDAGFDVRREELKAGQGFRVISGSCRAFHQRLIFLDRRLSQGDQIEFLIARCQSLHVFLTSEAFRAIPEKWSARLRSLVSDDQDSVHNGVKNTSGNGVAPVDQDISLSSSEVSNLPADNLLAGEL